jgi:hypothetical protein
MVTVTMPIEEYNALLKTQEEANKMAKINAILLIAIDRITVGGLELAREYVKNHDYDLIRENGIMKLVKLNKTKQI